MEIDSDVIEYGGSTIPYEYGTNPAMAQPMFGLVNFNKIETKFGRP